ncbi:MAG TPA: LLM class flavin-dependent oxidoreductase, partial [Methanomicrobiales archaeon]|nr:LLM class flavin-dependent oxidoreductase [Methanomicrobiales archaeon]
ARLYTRPKASPPIFGAAITNDTAEWVGGWADGLITTGRPLHELKQTIEAFRRGGGEGRPVHLKVDLSYARTENEALQGAWEQWRYLAFGNGILANTRTPEEFEAMAEYVRPEDMRKFVCVSADAEQHIAWLTDYVSLGIDWISLHNVNRDQKRFIRDFGETVLPAVLE